MASPIRERWKQPPTVYSVEERNKVVQIGGRVWAIPIFVLDQDGIDRIRLGYVCIACLECHEQPYPERCNHEGCLFPIRAHQDEVFERLYVGEMSVGPQSSLEDEWEWAKEEVARQRRGEQSLWLPTNFQMH